MQDQSADHRLLRIERQLNVLILLLGVLVTLALFAVVSSGVGHAGLLLFVLVPGVFVALLLTYVTAAILTPGRTRPDAESTTMSSGEAE